jgi:peptidyl-prolyl cis-trans isomerase SurA
LKEYLKNLYSKLNLNSLNEFEQYLKNYDITLNDIERKISIELLWNELIIQRYNNQIKIDRKKIKKKFQNKKTLKLKEYQLSEIIFNVKNKNLIKEKYIEITKSINEIGFENSASVFSIADTAKIGGDIGWINENSINIEIKKNISKLKIGKISEPIILSNGILILKVVDIRNSQMKIDMEAEYNKAANFERNRQLNQFSLIYYNKIKKNLEFNE